MQRGVFIWNTPGKVKKPMTPIWLFLSYVFAYCVSIGWIYIRPEAKVSTHCVPSLRFDLCGCKLRHSSHSYLAEASLGEDPWFCVTKETLALHLQLDLSPSCGWFGLSHTQATLKSWRSFLAVTHQWNERDWSTIWIHHYHTPHHATPLTIFTYF